MYNMLLKYMDKVTAKVQLEELLKNGVQYTDAKGGEHTEQRFSLQPLLEAYAALQAAVAARNWPLARSICVQKVGAAQANLPSCVVNQFFHPTRGFEAGSSTHFTSPLPRLIGGNDGAWYSASLDGKASCSFAFARGPHPKPLGVRGRSLVLYAITANTILLQDANSIHSLFGIRTAQLNTLAALLDLTITQESSSPPRPK